MTRPASYVSFSCPNMDCDWFCEIRWIPDSRVDPGYLDGDPPDTCELCGHPMGDDAEPCGPPEPDPDSLHEMGR